MATPIEALQWVALQIADIAQRFLTQTPAKLWFGCFAIGIVLELLFSKDQRPAARQYLTNIAHSVVYLAAIFVCSPTIFYLVATVRDALGFRGLFDLKLLDPKTLPNQIVMAALYLCALDFFQYWWHRAQHRFPILWDQHVAHHSDEAFNVTTTTRHHWTEFMLQAFAVSLPFTLLIEIEPVQAGFVGAVVGGFQFYTHLNLRIRLGPLSWLIGGPQNHRVHHSVLPEHRNKNFAVYFPIWDVVFGTYYHVRKDEFPPTGVAGVKLDTLPSLTMHTFVMWAKRLPWQRRPAST